MWGRLPQGTLTGRLRRGQDNDVTRAKFRTAFSDERRLDALEESPVLPDDVLDRIDEIVPPGTDIGALGQAYVPPAIQGNRGPITPTPPEITSRREEDASHRAGRPGLRLPMLRRNGPEQPRVGIDTWGYARVSIR